MSDPKPKGKFYVTRPLTDYRKLIRKEAEIERHLHREIHRTFRDRSQSADHWKTWESACHRWHTHSSSMRLCIDRAARVHRDLYDPDLLEFAICFLEEDPRFFRSGYLKAWLLPRLKRSVLTDSDQRRLRAVLLDAVHHRGGREFRRYCRLAIRLATPKLIADLEDAADSDCPRQASRAKLMLSYIASAPSAPSE